MTFIQVIQRLAETYVKCVDYLDDSVRSRVVSICVLISVTGPLSHWFYQINESWDYTIILFMFYMGITLLVCSFLMVPMMLGNSLALQKSNRIITLRIIFSSCVCVCLSGYEFYCAVTSIPRIDRDWISWVYTFSMIVSGLAGLAAVCFYVASLNMGVYAYSKYMKLEPVYKSLNSYFETLRTYEFHKKMNENGAGGTYTYTGGAASRSVYNTDNIDNIDNSSVTGKNDADDGTPRLSDQEDNQSIGSSNGSNRDYDPDKEEKEKEKEKEKGVAENNDQSSPRAPATQSKHGPVTISHAQYQMNSNSSSVGTQDRSDEQQQFSHGPLVFSNKYSTNFSFQDSEREIDRGYCYQLKQFLWPTIVDDSLEMMQQNEQDLKNVSTVVYPARLYGAVYMGILGIIAVCQLIWKTSHMMNQSMQSLDDNISNFEDYINDNEVNVSGPQLDAMKLALTWVQFIYEFGVAMSDGLNYGTWVGAIFGMYTCILTFRAWKKKIVEMRKKQPTFRYNSKQFPVWWSTR